MSLATIVLISTDQKLRESLQQVVAAIGDLTLQTVGHWEQARRLLDQDELVLVVIHVSKGGPVEPVEHLLEALSENSRMVVAVVVSDQERPRDKLKLLRRGVANWFARPLDLNQLTFHLDMLTVRTRFQLAKQARQQQAKIRSLEDDGDLFLYHSDEMGRMMEQVKMVAPQETTILLTGETGTGKTRLARLIHHLSGRQKEPFLVVNCGALSAQLIESELFGHIRGAFTGADRDRAGKFAEVARGTLLLDDVDTLPPEAQVKLLRAVEDRLFEPVGSNKSLPVQARLIAATNKSLEAEASAGRFRTDLFYRLNVVPFHLKPLRERRGIIGDLARKFLQELAKRNGRDVVGFTPEALRALEEYHWHGNIRELRNVVERAVALCPQPLVGLDQLPFQPSSTSASAGSEPFMSTPSETLASSPIAAETSYHQKGSSEPTGWSNGSLPQRDAQDESKAPAVDLNGGQKTPQRDSEAAARIATLAESKDVAELQAITEALASSNNNRSQAAQKLGISRPTLYKKLRRYGLLGDTAESEPSP